MLRCIGVQGSSPGSVPGVNGQSRRQLRQAEAGLDRKADDRRQSQRMGGSDLLTLTFIKRSGQRRFDNHSPDASSASRLKSASRRLSSGNRDAGFTGKTRESSASYTVLRRRYERGSPD